MRKIRIVTLVSAGALGLSLAACDTTNSRDRTIGGAAIGGVTGAVIGGAATGRAGGALAGGAIGAVGGGIIGNATTPRR